MTKSPIQLQKEVDEYLASDQAGGNSGVVVRVPQYETKTDDDHPGVEPPSQGSLGIGRSSESWKPLYWKRLVSEYKKEAPQRARHSEAALRVEIKVGHAPDDHTPFTYVDWGDPIDARGAVEFARKLVEDGGARYSMVFASASRPTARRSAGDRGVRYDLARLERGSGISEGPSIPVETQIWGLMSGDERAGVMRAVGITLGSGKKRGEMAMLRACAEHIRRHAGEYRHVLLR